MRKLIARLIVSIIFILVSGGSVYSNTAPTRISVSGSFDIGSKENGKPTQYIIDDSREVPAYKIVPPPAPTPQVAKPEDNRSWTKSKYKEIIQSVSAKYNLNPQLIHATIMTESEGRENAYRFEPRLNDASVCLGQILTRTARYLGYNGNIKDMYRPEVCIDLIGRYHRRTLDTYGDLNSVQLATAYNAGSPWKRPVYGHLSRFQKWYNETT